MSLFNTQDTNPLTAKNAGQEIARMMGMLPPYLKLSDVEFAGGYHGPYPGDIVSATGSPAVDALQAVPFWSGAGGVISEVAFNVTVVSGANGVARCGFYNADQLTLLPTTKIVDGGQFAVDAATGVKSLTGLSIVTLPNTWYSTVFICGTASPTVTTLGSGFHTLGRSLTTFNAQFGYVKVGFGYQALPQVFPASPTIMTSAPAMVCVRYSSYNRS